MSDPPQDDPQEDLGDLDALIRRVDPDRWISSRFIADAGLRADVIALYAFDHELARAPKVSSNPLIGEIRLTWWRETLDEIFEGRPVRRHPTAEALAVAVARRGLARAPLETLIDARYRDLDTTALDEAEALAWAGDTGGQAAEIAAGMLDPATQAGAARMAGAAWALGRRAGEGPAQRAAFAAARAAGRREARRLSAAAFPAVAHAVLAGRPSGTEAARRLRVTLAVALGRI
ncbi:MAG: phytoene/squalene synthase family protein [Phenylobacterium sp.]|nr:MAG: phytoene/squalene synthase family protein [Phenylobacterium sp.]